jgi:D-alanyl-D-alanine carboxypeptidase
MFWNKQFLGSLLLLILIGGCRPGVGAILQPTAVVTTETRNQVAAAAVTNIPTPTFPSTVNIQRPPTLTPIPTVTPSATSIPSATPTATATSTATPVGPCAERIPATDDLLTLVTYEYGLGRDYQPADLVLLTDYFPVDVTMGYPTEVRQVVIEPLVSLIQAMQQEGLRPRVLSGYRSYSSQAVAWAKWNEKTPDTAAVFSARPGHSEHQLGTTLDFGSPELAGIIGTADMEFHTYFYQTSEGEWLAAHAHEYGFTLSYPRDSLEITGFYYEPWHYRYVGVELAAQLREQGTYLVKYLLENFPPPCTR